MTEYMQNDSVNVFGRIPRFGHSTDFSFLFGDSKSDKSDYATGTIFVGVFLISVFVLWALILAIFMCCGPRKVGLLAGFRMKQPWGQKTFRTPAIIRTLFLISSIIVIAGAAVSTFVWGFNDLQTYSSDGLDISKEFTNIAIEGKTIVNYLKTPVTEYGALRNTVVDELRPGIFCTGNPGVAISAKKNELVQNLYDLEDFSKDEFSTLRTEVFTKMENVGKEGEYYFGVFGVKDWQVYTYFVLFSVISLFFMLGTILAAAGKPFKALACFNTWFLLPIFLVLVTLAWLIVSFYGVSAVMNSDFCSGGDAPGSPDVTAQKIINATQDGVQNTIYDYWVDSDCATATFPLDFIPHISTKLSRAIMSISSLETAMNEEPNLSTICGGKDFGPIRGYFALLTADYTELSANVTIVEDLLSCENVHPLYVDLVHEVTCSEIPESALWAFGGLLIVAFFSMVMITCRTAWLDAILNDGLSSVTVSEPDLGDEKPQSIRSESFFDASPRSKYEDVEIDDKLTLDLKRVSIPVGHELDDVIEEDGRIKCSFLAEENNGNKLIEGTDHDNNEGDNDGTARRSSFRRGKGNEEEDVTNDEVPVESNGRRLSRGSRNEDEAEDLAKEDWDNGGRYFRRGKTNEETTYENVAANDPDDDVDDNLDDNADDNEGGNAKDQWW